MKKNGLTYAEAGVDIDAGNALVERIKPLARATRRRGAEAELGGFGGLFDLKAAGFTDPILVAANDGVGTKLKIAIESGLNDAIGIDLVAMCVNDLLAQGAEPLFFLDYYATGKLDPQSAESVIAGIAAGCLEAGAALIGGETAEMPGHYQSADYDLAGFAVGAVERGKVLPRRDIRAGDRVLGLRSSGLHSNGFSLVRKIVASTGLDWGQPAPFAPDMTLARALLTPTRIYVKPVLPILQGGDAVKALAHITGGGFTDNLPRALPENLAIDLDLAAIPLLEVFRWLAASGGVAETEMLRTLNCGVGMALIVHSEEAEAVARALASAGEEPVALGVVTAREAEAQVNLQGRLGL